MIGQWVLLSINSSHAANIYTRTKRAELRKSFAASARLVVLYETAPVAAITGAFSVAAISRLPVQEAVRRAAELGVPRERAETYFGGQTFGSVVEIGGVARFAQPISLSEAILADHRFRVPQAFVYLAPAEPLTELVLARFARSVAAELDLVPISESRLPEFQRLVREEVTGAYEDIDDDFIQQVFDVDVGADAAFSTTRKHALEIQWQGCSLGVTVLTEKCHGAWKSGPTVIRAPYRGVALGQAVRVRIEEHVRAHGARSLYCTCPNNRPGVVGYLLNSGMDLQARLRGHLSRGRDELVMCKRISRRRAQLARASGRGRPRRLHHAFEVRRIKAGRPELRDALAFFLREMPRWYFGPPPGFADAIEKSMWAWEKGENRYSAKARAMWVAHTRGGKVLAAAVVTRKRSGMGKINIVAAIESWQVASRLMKAVVAATPDLRRIYLTVPCSQACWAEALSALGFLFEGILIDPFGTGRDHACYGMVRR